jgi:hypothetical protein
LILGYLVFVFLFPLIISKSAVLHCSNESSTLDPKKRIFNFQRNSNDQQKLEIECLNEQANQNRQLAKNDPNKPLIKNNQTNTNIQFLPHRD